MFRYALWATLTLLMTSASANSDWAYDMTNELCSEHSRVRVATGVRNQVESSVRRSEASIDPPVSVGELGCLESLMSLQLGGFAPIGSLGGLFGQAFDGVPGVSGPAAKRFCSIAVREWRDITNSLNRPFFDSESLFLPRLLSQFSELGTNSGVRKFSSGSPEQRTRDSSPEPGLARDASRGSREVVPPISETDPVGGIWDSLYRGGGSR